MQRSILFFLSWLWVGLYQVNAQQVALTAPAQGASFNAPVQISLEAAVSGVQNFNPAYIHVTNILTGYRKLKFGYSPTNIYAPGNNVIAGGNNTLQITLKDFGGNCNWNAMYIKPNSVGSLLLAPYIMAAGGIGSEWKTISIPLADFQGVDWTSLAYIEFPYSANAGNFDIAFSEIKFVGGSTPFLWFGEGKTDNKHDGFGGAGQLVAELVPASYPTVYPAKVEFYANNVKVGEDAYAPYSTRFSPSDTGWITLTARLVMNTGDAYWSEPRTIHVSAPGSNGSLTVNLIQPAQGQSFYTSQNIAVQAITEGIPVPETNYLLVTNNMSGYRKLKLGNNPVSIYGTYVNVIAGGNNQLEITLKDVAGGGTNWSRIMFKPNGLGNLSLAPYVNSVGGISDEWKTIVIPLANFDPSIDFSNLQLLEFPYSADAGNFQIAIKSIIFTGGSTPFVYFGENKTNNKHDGLGGPGQLVANLIEATNTGDYVEKVAFYLDNQKIAEDFSFPFQTILSGLSAGSHQLKAVASSRLGLTAESATVSFMVETPPVAASPLGIALTSPQNNTQYYLPTDLTLEAVVSGEVLPGPDYLKVVNNQTGFRKLKLGYTPGNIYGPGQNVIAGGNNKLEIVLKDFNNTADWSKIRIRPSGIGLLNLAPYMASAQDLGNGWKKIAIPLSHFDPSIDFSSLSMFEFPYSASAPFFEIGIASMIFTGGTTPFVWFGEGKTNNPHDGFNGPGQLLATLVNGNAGQISARKVAFYDHGVLLGIDSIKPYSYSYQNVPSGLRKLTAKVFDSQGAVRVSDTVNVLMIDAPPAGSLMLTITFDGVPTYADIDKAKLRYNKSFAYSLTLDDGYRCAYKNAFMLLNGGYVAGNNTTYPGLYYTDGCGNDIPFKGGLAIYSLGATGNDLHVNSLSYINWPEVQVMIAAGWNILNHTLQHAAGTGTNYVYQIVENTRYIKQKTGYVTRHFVVPSGDQNYVAPAFANGMKTVVANNAAYQGFPNGLVVNNQLSYNNFTLFKRFMYDSYYDTTNIFQPIQTAANLSVNGNYLWYNDFTHRVDFGNYVGSINFPLFAWYMKWVEKNYGKSGADNVWMAPIQEVYEYLYVRDHTPMTVSRTGNVMRVVIDRSQLPDSLLKYALSFVVNSDVNIASVVMSQPGTITWRGNTPVKLINIEWNNNALKHSPATQSGLFADQKKPSGASEAIRMVNPAGDLLQVAHEQGMNISAVEIFDLSGKKLVSFEISPATSSVYSDISVLKPGVYLMYIRLEDGTLVRRKLLKI